jgi:D-alanyl-D-alanine carboxypeptidase
MKIAGNLLLLVAAMAAALTTPDVARAAVDCAQHRTAIDAAVKKAFTSQQLPSLTVGVVCGDSVIYAASHGFSDVDDQVAASPATLYEIGSITKQFTAAAIISLEHQGKLSLQDAVGKYVPEFPPAANVTILQLLNHTSGLSEYAKLPNFSTLEVNTTTPLQTLQDLNPTFVSQPGTQFHYSSANYVLLGMIVERITGQNWRDYIRSNFFAPANMTSATFYDPYSVVPHRAFGYAGVGSTLRHTLYHDPSWAFGEGGIVATVRDLSAWDRALFDNHVLSATMFSEMQQPGTLLDGEKTQYGKGFFLGQVLGYREVWHGGLGIGGFRSENILFPDNRVAFVYLSNTYDFDPAPLTAALAHIVFDKP